MNTMQYILAVNAGSSSLKIALFDINNLSKSVHQVSAQNISLSYASLTLNGNVTPATFQNHNEAATSLARWLTDQTEPGTIVAVGHRIVHGGSHFYAPTVATDKVLSTLHTLAPLDPTHLPVQLDLVETFKKLLPHAQHTLCFDTSLFHNLPMHSKLLPLPRDFADKGLRRYGFHGLSYTYILDVLARRNALTGKVVIAHLGSGASLAAFNNGEPIDTTMAMTPASGIPMSTRSGDIDPGLVLYLTKTHGLTIERFNEMVHLESGLLGMSGSSADMEKLLATENDNIHAKEAVEVFCHSVKKVIGGFAAALGGLDTLVFTGGMGEHAPKIRSRVCNNLEFLGVNIDQHSNSQNADLISSGRVAVLVLPTNEAIVIAQETAQSLTHRK